MEPKIIAVSKTDLNEIHIFADGLRLSDYFFVSNMNPTDYNFFALTQIMDNGERSAPRFAEYLDGEIYGIAVNNGLLENDPAAG